MLLLPLNILEIRVEANVTAQASTSTGKEPKERQEAAVVIAEDVGSLSIYIYR